jgi:hypothetical protein
MLFEHPLDVQFFKYNDCESINQFAAFLMGKISALVGNSFMHMSNYFAAFVSLRAAFTEPLPELVKVLPHAHITDKPVEAVKEGEGEGL